MNIFQYKWWWSKFGGRPWTYIARDFYHQAEYGVLVGLFFFGYAVGMGGMVSWKWFAVLVGAYTLGFIHGHFFWGSKYVENQPGNKFGRHQQSDHNK